MTAGATPTRASSGWSPISSAKSTAEYVLDEGAFGTRDIVAQGKLVFGVAVGLEWCGMITRLPVIWQWPHSKSSPIGEEAESANRLKAL